MFVIDTNVASELMRPVPTPAVAAWIAERDAAEMYLTAVSEAELRFGVAILPQADDETRWRLQCVGGSTLASLSGFCRSKALRPEPMQRSLRAVAKRVGPLARPTARSLPYHARAAPSSLRGTCETSKAPGSMSSILGRRDDRHDRCLRGVADRPVRLRTRLRTTTRPPKAPPHGPRSGSPSASGHRQPDRVRSPRADRRGS